MNQTDLVDLITSLTPIEKQQFKKSFDNNTDFVFLFDYINKNKSFDPKKINAFLNKKRKSKNKEVKTFSSGHISVLKNYLQEKIMESLRNQYIPKRINYEIAIRTLNADILLEKGLNQIAKDEIRIAKKKSLNSSFPIERLLLYRRESIIQFYEDYANSSIEDIIELYDNRIEAAEQLMLEIKYARILTILSFQYFRGINDPSLLRAFMNEDYMQDYSLAKETGTQYLFYWVHALFEEAKNQPEKAIQFFEQALQVWIDNPNFIKVHTRMYLGSCFTYLKYILQQKNSGNIILKEKDLEFLLERIPKLNLPKDVAIQWEQLFLLAQLLIFRKSGQYESIITKVQQSLEFIEKTKTTTDFTKIIVHYFTAIAFFHQKKYHKTNDRLIEILDSEQINLSANPEYSNHVYILFLITQFELKNHKYLKQQIKKTKKKLEKISQLGLFETGFLQMISQLISPRYLGQEDVVYDRWLKRLREVMDNENTTQHIEYQFVIDWIITKIEFPFSNSKT